MRGSYLLIILFCIIIFLGCGGGGGGSGVGPELVSGQISGQIILDETLTNERAVIASHSLNFRASSFDNILVFLEEMPTRAVYADSEGKYSFTDLPLDCSFHIIARINSLNGKVYKTRTEEIYLGKKHAQVTQNINVDKSSEAKYQIRLQVKDTKDNKVSRCKIWLWGEEFTLDESGCYLSPKMPLGASGILKVIPPTNKDLLTLESKIDSTVFQSDIQGVSAVTLPPSGITQKKAPYVSIRVGETMSGGFALRLYGSAVDPQNDVLELEWETSVGSFTYESMDKSYVDWGIPTEQTTAVITLKASQVSSSIYPLFWSKVELPITISQNGTVSYPGEIVIKPVLRTIDVIASASEQITGDTISSYEIVASFPNNSELFYAWDVSDGSIISGKYAKKMYWKSPFLNEKETKLATLTAYVSDDIATISKSILVKVTSFPVITFSSPLTTDFYPGPISFRGNAKDNFGNFIAYEDYKWYLATSSNELQLMQNEGASFTYNFVSQGSYTICLSAKDSSGSVGTGSMVISILNCPPDINILSPENDGGYSSKNKILCKVKVSDYEDGDITSPEQIMWFSDIDGNIGSGTEFILDSLTKNKKHKISVEAKDSQGGVSSASIIIWYDMPARITLTPESGAVFFEGSTVSFTAKGIDANSLPLASSTYRWYLDSETLAWKTGISSFSVNDLSAGLHSIKVVGANSLGDVNSEVYWFEAGWPLPEIISPVSGTRFDPESAITFSAVSLSTGSLVLNWYIDDSSDSSGTNNTLTTELEVGPHTIRYEGTDTSGVLASSSIDIVVERKPQIALNYASGSCFFTDKQIPFHAECKDSFDKSISDENIKWYFLDSGYPILWKTGSLFSVSQGSSEGLLAAGFHTVRVEAVGPYGSVASKSFGFESGIAPLSIVSPVADNSYDVGQEISFESNIEKESLPVAWFVDGTLIHKGSSSFKRSFSEGVYNIKAIATDSANVTSSCEIVVSVGLHPIMDIQMRDVKNNKVDPAGFIIFAGKPITFIGSGTSPFDGSAIDGSAMTWTLSNVNDVSNKQTYSGFSELTVDSSSVANLGQGLGNVELRSVVNESFIGVKNKQIYFNLPLPTFNLPASDTVIPFDVDDPDNTICNASGFPESVDSVNYEWYLNWGNPGCKRLYDADPAQEGVQLTLDKGENYLSLVATDSLGQVCKMTKRIYVDNPPSLEFYPPKDYSNTNAYIFDGFNITLKASATASIAGYEDISIFKWYLGEEKIFKCNGKNISNTDIGLVAGENIVTLTAEDYFGVVATITHNIYWGEMLPQIISPADNQSFQNVNIEFEATGSSNIGMVWKLNNQLLDFEPNTLNITVSKEDDRLINGDNVITYGGIDSAENEAVSTLHFNFASSSGLPKIEIKLANDRDLQDSVLFKRDPGEYITINGSATGIVNNDTIDGSKMTWTLYKKDDESNTRVLTNTSTLLFSDIELDSIGTWVLSLTAIDELGFNNSLKSEFYYGYPLPNITYPANESLYSISDGDNMALIGNNSVDVSLKMYWIIDSGEPIGPGFSINNTLGRGYHTVTYVGSDSSGLEKQTSSVLVVNDSPSIAIKYKKTGSSFFDTLQQDSMFFEDSYLELQGIATKKDGSEVDSSNVNWLKCSSQTDSGSNLVSGNKEPILSDSMMGDGTWYLRFRAVDNDFSSYPFSEDFIGSMAIKITTGINKPRFIGAVDNQRVDEDGTITFTVNDISPLTGYWSVDGIASHSVTERLGDDLCFTFDVTSLDPNVRRNYHKVYYGATDSNGNTYIAETSILVDSGPKFTNNSPKIITDVSRLGTGKASGLDYSIIKSEGNIINLELGATTNSGVNTISWHSLSVAHDTELSSFSRNFSIGSYTYLVTITDEFGIATSSLLSFWVWGYEAISVGYQPIDIVSDNSSYLYVSKDSNTLYKYTRDTDSLSPTSGSLISNVSSSSSDISVKNLFYDSSSLYSLTKPSSGSNPMITKWKPSDLSITSENPVSGSPAVSDIGGFIIKNSKIYVTDKTNSSNNHVEIFYQNGTPYISSPYLFKTPYGIVNADSRLFVADNGDDKIVTLDLDGNDKENPIVVKKPLGITHSSSTQRLYAAGKDDSDNHCIYVVNSNTYEKLYSFKVDDACNLAICGTGETSDLYITDKTNKKIIRIRSGYSW